mgnify:FL=1
MFVKIISFYKICTENVKKRIISGCKHHNLMTSKFAEDCDEVA